MEYRLWSRSLGSETLHGPSSFAGDDKIKDVPRAFHNRHEAPKQTCPSGSTKPQEQLLHTVASWIRATNNPRESHNPTSSELDLSPPPSLTPFWFSTPTSFWKLISLPPCIYSPWRLFVVAKRGCTLINANNSLDQKTPLLCMYWVRQYLCPIVRIGTETETVGYWEEEISRILQTCRDWQWRKSLCQLKHSWTQEVPREKSFCQPGGWCSGETANLQGDGSRSTFRTGSSTRTSLPLAPTVWFFTLVLSYPTCLSPDFFPIS